MMAKIGVIIPVYNVAPYLKRCLDSVLAQTFTDWQLLLVDDGSTDGSGKICATYAERDARIKVIHQTNAGAAAARNAGLDQNTAEYIAFIDADDYVEANYLAAMFDALQANRTKLSVCGTERHNADGSVELRATMPATVMTAKAVLTCLIRGDDPITSGPYAKLYHRDLFRELRFPVEHISEDLAVMYQLVAQCDRIAAVSLPLYHYCYQSTSVTVTTHMTIAYLDYYHYYQAMADYIMATYPDLRDECERQMTLRYLNGWRNVLSRRDIAVTYQRALWRWLKQHRAYALKRHLIPEHERFLRATYLGRRGMTIAWRLVNKLRHLGKRRCQ